MNLFSILDRATGKWPDAVAVVDHRRQMTYRELRAGAESLANELRQAGVLAGDKVGALLPRGIEDVLACFAVARLGGIVVQISPASKAAEVAQLEEKLNLDWLLHDCEYERLVFLGDGDGSRSIEALPFSARIRRSGHQTTAAPEREQLLKLNAAAIGFSSGTTSESKSDHPGS